MRFLRRLLIDLVLFLKGYIKMATDINATVQALTDQVAATEAGEASAEVLIQGIPALIQNAVDTAQNLPQLQANLTALQGRLAASAATLAAAVVAAPTVPAAAPPTGGTAAAPVTVAGTGTTSDTSGQA